MERLGLRGHCFVLLFEGPAWAARQAACHILHVDQPLVHDNATPSSIMHCLIGTLMMGRLANNTLSRNWHNTTRCLPCQQTKPSGATMS